MGTLIYKYNEGTESCNWETQVYISKGHEEVLIVQTWFDGSSIMSKNNIVLPSVKLREIAERIEL